MATKLAQFRNIDYLFNIYRNDKFIHQQRWLVKKIRCMEVSSKDVAKFADVSQTTVSRLLNAPGRVKKTLKKVMDGIEELNYIPDGNARSLVQRKTRTIALISGPLHNPFFAETTTAIINYANPQGFRTNVHSINDDNSAEVYYSVKK